MNHELPNVQAGFRKGRGTRDHIANIRWIIEKAREFQKNICLCLCQSLCVNHNRWSHLAALITLHYSYSIRSVGPSLICEENLGFCFVLSLEAFFKYVFKYIYFKYILNSCCVCVYLLLSRV